MKKTIKSKATASRKSTLTAGKKTAFQKSTQAPKKIISPPPEVEPVRPGGKLGLILERLSTKAGATADELVDETGWQRHSVLGALSKLKARGFEFNLDAHADRKAYRLTELKG